MNEDVMIRRLEEAQYYGTTGLSFFQIEFNDAIEAALVQLMRSIAQQGDCWQELNIFGCVGHIDAILQLAVSLDIFSSITIKGMDRGERLGKHAALSIGVGMKFSKHLKQLHLGHLLMEKDEIESICSGMSHGSSGSLKFLIFSRIIFAEEAVDALEQGLKNNRSLVGLAVTSCSLRDDQLSKLIQAVVGHPALRSIKIFGNAGHAQTLESLSRLLKATRHLETLDLHHQSWRKNGLQSHMHILAEGLKGNNTLKRLNLSSNLLADDDMESISNVLWTMGSLIELDLDLNNITDRGLEILSSQTIPSKLKRLRLTGNDFSQNGVQYLVKILQIHLELGFLDCHRFWARSSIREDIQHYMDLNRCGRILLRDGDNYSASLWPRVLARANRKMAYDVRRADVIYHLLHGPALFKRKDTIEMAKEMEIMEENTTKKRSAPKNSSESSFDSMSVDDELLKPRRKLSYSC